MTLDHVTAGGPSTLTWTDTRWYRPSPMIRIGFLGAGFIARYHAFQLESCAEPHEITAVHDPSAHRAERFAEWQHCQAMADIDAVLDVCDAVFVCTWTSEHLPAVRAA